MIALAGKTQLNSPDELGKVSLYIHFPFCRRKCAYCDFASEDWQLERIPAYTTALVKEIELLGAGQRQTMDVRTLYFGGGTPNLIGEENFRKVMQAIRAQFNTDQIEEITVEINPGAITTDFPATLKAEGVNRISLGCQSYDAGELLTLGRIHSTIEIDETLAQLKRNGFSNVSLDFIYGIPGQTPDSWQRTLVKAVQTGAKHLSLYCLSYEAGTPLYQARMNGKVQSISDEQEWQMYAMAHDILKQAGYEHYEISNWARPGFEAKHNSVYWKGGTYLGCGPAAHSFNGEWRWWNERAVDDYLKALQNDRLPVAERERLTRSDRITEMLFLGLRMKAGLDVAGFERLTGIEFRRIFVKLLQKFGPKTESLITLRSGSLTLTPRGWFICDTIIENILAIIEEEKDDYQKCS